MTKMCHVIINDNHVTNCMVQCIIDNTEIMIPA